MSQEMLEMLSGISDELWPILSDRQIILGCELILTCGACPEQYDVFLGKVKIGYLRLRHGRFYASYPDCGGEVVYSSFPKGDGIFGDDEREEELTKAVKALLIKHTGIPEQITVYLLNMETSDQYGKSNVVGVYSTRLLAENASDTITQHRTFIEEMVLDAYPKE